MTGDDSALRSRTGARDDVVAFREPDADLHSMSQTEVHRWEPVCPLEELPVGDAIRMDFNGKAYAVYHTQSGLYATEGLCTHERASLVDGFVEGEFHIPTGKAIRIPAKIDLGITD